ncbi:MAG: hypothetical protein Q7K42_04680 [Candidatus Diapherotrites archaeon]|nr:hypothetical protein [Candidatus Diapherotrites archaeon]
MGKKLLIIAIGLLFLLIGCVNTNNDIPTLERYGVKLSVLNAFEEKWTECSPAEIEYKLDGSAIYNVKILQKNYNSCEVVIKYISPNPVYIGNEMTCLLDNSKFFEAAYEEEIKSQLSTCTGKFKDQMLTPPTTAEIEAANNKTNLSDPLDCGTDLNCFIQASETCKLSKVTFVPPQLDVFGIKMTGTNYLELKGLKEEKCIYYAKRGSTQLEFPEGTSEEIISFNTQAYKTMENKEGTCKFETSDLTNMLSEWNKGNFSTEDLKVAECEGEYFNP